MAPALSTKFCHGLYRTKEKVRFFDVERWEGLDAISSSFSEVE
jgi:hypothetical protein